MRFCAGFAVLLLVLSSCVMLSAAERPRPGVKTPVAAAKTSYERDVAPLVKKYCAECHGAGTQIAGLNVLAFPSEASVVKGRAVWEKIAQNLQSRHMPPAARPQPTQAERDRLTGWIHGRLAEADCGLRDPGRVTMRRLNRAEYNNTVRDLLGVDFHPADDFPSDDVGYGFDNIGDVLTMSPILMEKYLAAAEKIAGKAIVTPDPPMARFEAERIPETGGDGVVNSFYRLLVSNGEVWVDYTFPRDGEYLLQARVFGQQAGTEPAKMAFRLDGKDLQAVDVPETEDAPKVYERREKLQAGKHRFSIAFLNDFYDPKSRDPKNKDRNLGVDYLEVVGPLDAAPAELPESHRRLFISQPAPATKDERARKILQSFARRAYRRPVSAEEVERLVRVTRLAEKEGESFERGIQLGVEAALVSPQFLFRVELDPAPNNPQAKRPLNDYELASRLSYFLWSSMPDDALFSLAEKGQLRKPEVLEAQAKRMLRDPKARALVENFGDQWLTLRNLQNVNPDPSRFPDFNNDLRAAMLKETELFFESIVKEDRSVLDFLDGKYTFLNERLAKHYGIDWVKGDHFRRVVLTGDQRAGILTQASILTVTSNPTRTSPVKRGKWVLEQILGTPPPPPPPNVPELKEGKDAMLTGTLRQRMEQHRKDPGCASCHSRMDPIGFGLENFDGVGAWRTKEGDLPLDASGTLPDGKSFQGPLQLITILKEQKQQFVRSLTEKMLTYALGRGVEHYDRCNLDRMASVAATKGYRFSALVTEIVKSEPFRMRRGDGGGQ